MPNWMLTSQTRTLLIKFVKSHPGLYEFLRYGLYAPFRSRQRRKIFRKIYETNAWGNDFSVSGPGSSWKSTENLRRTLPLLVDAVGARSFLDVPCGDFQWMNHVDLRVQQYYGADIVPALVKNNQCKFADRGEFLHLDLLRDRLPEVDVVFCRDCFIHFSFRDIHIALINIRNSRSKYLFTTTYPDHPMNVDTVTPYWRPLNLQISPFNFPEPLHLIADCAASGDDHKGKYLGVWYAKDLRTSGYSLTRWSARSK